MPRPIRKLEKRKQTFWIRGYAVKLHFGVNGVTTVAKCFTRQGAERLAEALENCDLIVDPSSDVERWKEKPRVSIEKEIGFLDRRYMEYAIKRKVSFYLVRGRGS